MRTDSCLHGLKEYIFPMFLEIRMPNVKVLAGILSIQGPFAFQMLISSWIPHIVEKENNNSSLRGFTWSLTLHVGPKGWVLSGGETSQTSMT